jgi:hypothetical protein
MDSTRGQTTLDFAIGVGVFLAVVLFAFAFIPGILSPFDLSGEEEPAQSNQIADKLSKDLLGSRSGPRVTDRYCAVEFCNEVLWGTLNAEILVHPETRRDLGSRLEDAVADLEYGNVALNHWPSLSYALGITPWGAYPGQPLEDIQSGRGFVHNTMMFDKPQKSVIDGPFRMSPKPPWFATNEAADEIAPRLTEFEREPAVGKLLGVLWTTVFG